MIRKKFFSKMSGKIKSFWGFILLFMVLCACYQEPFYIDLSEYGNKIVVEGSIANHAGPHLVKISYTVSNQSREMMPPVKWANVTIEDDMNNIYQLTEIRPGIYEVDMTGIPDRTYTLKILSDGDLYTASSKMPQPLTIESVKFISLGTESNQYYLSVTFIDQQRTLNFCKINIYKNGELYDHYLYNDNLSDGQIIVLDNFDVHYNKSDVATVELLTLNKDTYDYYASLDMIEDDDNSEMVNSFIPVSTYTPPSNITNGALGYFYAHTIHIFTGTVE